LLGLTLLNAKSCLDGENDVLHLYESMIMLHV
jgi:hypothetical protein